MAVPPRSTAASTAASGRYIRCSPIGDFTGMKLDVGPSARKKATPSQLHGARCQKPESVMTIGTASTSRCGNQSAGCRAIGQS